MRALLAAIAAAALLAVLPGAAGAFTEIPAGDTSLQFPNLMADAPGNVELQTYKNTAYAGGQNRLLIRFDGYIDNAAPRSNDACSGQPEPGALQIYGQWDATNSRMDAIQRVWSSTCGEYHDFPLTGTYLYYETADGHNHWHVHNAALYSLRDLSDTTQVAPSQKIGFCMGDSFKDTQVGGPHARSDNAPSAYFYYGAGNGFSDCGQGQTDGSAFTGLDGADPLFEGISHGWSDDYARSLFYQWIDVSDVSPGTYLVREDVNPYGAIQESSLADDGDGLSGPVTVPGYVAQPLDLGQILWGQPDAITLSSTTFSATDSSGHSFPGPESFQIVNGPAHGTLDQTPGTAFSGPTVIYTPDPGYSGPDSFTYAARDSTTQFPLDPPTATVSLDVGPIQPSVLIWDAPASMPAGSSAQLRATVADDSPAVTWSVDGVPGGSSSVGTISSTGLYTAPAAIPPGGTVTIGARISSGATDQRTIAIGPPLAAASAPSSSTGRPGPPSVAIGGAPARMFTGTSAHLRARVRGDQPGVTWIVDGVRGGTRRTGRISPGGRYTAPATVPRSGHVVIEARTAHGGTDHRTIRIVRAPRSQAAPLPALGAHAVSVGPLRGLTAARQAGWLVARVTPARAGRVTLSTWAGRRLLGRCRTASPAGRTYACRLALPRGVSMRTLSVTASLRVRGRIVGFVRWRWSTAHGGG